MSELGQGIFIYRGPYTVSDTPFALELRGASEGYIIARNGEYDARLTERFRACGFGQLAEPGVPRQIAAWLRSVHAEEQPKRLEFEATCINVYQLGGTLRVTLEVKP